jgi:hypothetical protein
VNVGSAGAVVVNGGAGGTPSSITLTNGAGLPTAGLTGHATGRARAGSYRRLHEHRGQSRADLHQDEWHFIHCGRNSPGVLSTGRISALIDRAPACAFPNDDLCALRLLRADDTHSS